MNELTRIFLGGKLGKMFGKEWKLYVNSPAEALHAININTGGKLKDYLRQQKRDTFYKIAINKKYNLLNEQEIKQPTGNRDIFIMPSPRGGSGVVRIIIGVILIIVGIIINIVSLGAGSPVGAFLINMGIGLVIGGIITLIIGNTGVSPNTPSSEATGGSSLFANGAGVIAQGAAVKLIYGRALVLASDTPIAIAFNNFDQNANYSPNDGLFTGNPLGYPGGYYYPYDIVDPTNGFPFYNQSPIPVAATPPTYP